MVVRSLIFTVLVAASAVPALASSVIHSANNEMGYTTHPEHAQSGKSRNDVSDLERARNHPSWSVRRVGGAVSMP